MASSASAGAAAITRMVSRSAFFKAGVRTVLALDTRHQWASIEASVDRRAWGRDPCDRRRAGQPAGAPRYDSLALPPAFFQRLAGADHYPLAMSPRVPGCKAGVVTEFPVPHRQHSLQGRGGPDRVPIPARATTNRDVKASPTTRNLRHR